MFHNHTSQFNVEAQVVSPRSEAFSTCFQDHFYEPQRIVICALIERSAQREAGPAKVDVKFKAGPQMVRVGQLVTVGLDGHVFFVGSSFIFCLETKILPLFWDVFGLVTCIKTPRILRPSRSPS